MEQFGSQNRILSHLVLAVFLTIICLLFLSNLFLSAGAAAQPVYGVYYEIDVAVFQDSDGDGIGDLQGVIDRLDYLNDGKPGQGSDLGVRGISLLPILKTSASDSFAVDDFYHIDPKYGTLDDLQQLIRGAHQQGMQVLLDIPFNHTADSHPWFQSALRNYFSPYRNYYVWANSFTNTQQRKPDGSLLWHPASNGKYYGYYGSDQPDLNYNNPDVRAEMMGVAKYWLSLGIDGFRLDGADQIFADQDYDKNFYWWALFRSEMEKIHSDLYLLGVVTSSPEEIAPYLENGFDYVLDYPLAAEIREGLSTGNSNGFNQTLDLIYDTYGTIGRSYVDAPAFVGEDGRIIAEYNGSPAMTGVAAAICLTLPGNPFIRQETGQDSSEHLNRIYRDLIGLRNRYSVLTTGGISFLKTGSGVIGYIRYYSDKYFYIYHNLTDIVQKISVARGVQWHLVYDSAYRQSYVPSSDGRQLVFELPPYSSIILER